MPLEGAKEALEAEAEDIRFAWICMEKHAQALQRAKTQLPEIEKAARKRLEEEAEEKMRQSAAAAIEREVRDRLIREAEEKLRPAAEAEARARVGDASWQRIIQ